MNRVFKIVGISSVLLCSCLLGALISLLQVDWIDISELGREKVDTPSVVLDDEGNELFRFEREKRTPITYDQLPPVLIDAFVAAEDHDFFSHHGVSFRGILRSALVNLVRRRVVQGASTMTQQLAKLLFLTYDRTMWRKVKEMFLALQLERQLTKAQILELYLNTVYFGRGVYGVQVAAQRFWNKSIAELNLAESATLAAVAKSARFYSPLNAPEQAKRRRNIILGSMKKLGMIAEEDLQTARVQELDLSNHIAGNPIRLYVQEWIRSWAEQQWGKDALYSRGFAIRTTINKAMQEHAEHVFSTRLSGLHKTLNDQIDGGLLTLEVKTGRMKAIVAGLDFKKSQFNRVFQAVRQTGSSFKPFVYAAALQKGIGLETTSMDEKMTVTMADGQLWEPRNWNRKFEGQMTRLKALTNSVNSITIRTLLEVGYDEVMRLAERCGITRELNPYPSLALGTPEATVEENTAAFNVFANNGEWVKPYLVEWVKDKWGNKVYAHHPQKRRVLDAVITSKMVSALAVRMHISRKRFGPKHWLQGESIGKTGSTNNAASTWFVGSTPDYTTAVYVGRDDNKGLGRFVFASQTTFPIWLAMHKKLPAHETSFYYEPHLEEVSINWNTGEKVAKKKSSDVVEILT